MRNPGTARAQVQTAADGAASGGQGMNESRDEWAVESRFGDGRMDLCGILWMSKIDETRIYMTPPPLAK